MIKFIQFATFLGTLASASYGQTVTTSASAPVDKIIDSSPNGGVDTALFDEDANSNHSRGQLFSLPDGDGTEFELTAITIRKSNTQTYLNDILTLRIFEGTIDQWTTGTGHETAIDGDDYLVDTTVTLVHTEAFTLNGEFLNNDYVTFELATPITVNESSDFGFFMTYDQTGGTEDRFRHRENGTGGGRLSITLTAHGATPDTSRKVVYFIHGEAPDTGIINPTISASESFIEAGTPVDLSATFDTTADTATLTTPTGSVDLKEVDASDDIPGDGSVVISDSPTSSFTYEIVVTKAGEVDENATAQVLVANPADEAPNNAFSSAIKGDSPLFYYRFEDDPDAGFLLDSSGNGHHTTDFTANLGLGSGPGGMQNAAQFASSSILVPATSNMGASFTATMVVNNAVLQTNANQNFLSITDGELIGRSVFYAREGLLRSFISGAETNNTGGTVPPDDTSCLLHFVFDADPDDNPETADQVLRYYINGELQGSEFTLPNAADQNVGNWVLGSHKGRTFNFVQGWMDETAVFETVLTDIQIATHATAFFAAADPLLGLVTDLDSVDWGNSATLTWKVSDQATAVTINGVAQTIDGGGIYSTTVTPTADTTYTLEVTAPGGPFMSTVDIAVVGAPPAAPQIIAISSNGASPPIITLELTGEPNATYFIQSSANLTDGFPIEVADDVIMDENGYATATFQSLDGFPFFRADPSP